MTCYWVRGFRADPRVDPDRVATLGLPFADGYSIRRPRMVPAVGRALYRVWILLPCRLIPSAWVGEGG